MIYVNISSSPLELYGCPCFPLQEDCEGFFESTVNNDEIWEKNCTDSKILPQRVFEVSIKILCGQQVWLGVPLTFLGQSEVQSYPSNITCLWTPWDPCQVAEIQQPTHSIADNGNICEGDDGSTIYYSANVEAAVHTTPSRASPVLTKLHKYQCFETQCHVFGDTKQVWARVNALDGWICVSSVTEGSLDAQRISLKHADDPHAGQFSKYFRNVFRGKASNNLPVRTQPMLKSPAAGRLKGWAVFPAEHCVVSQGHQIWVKVCSMDLDDGAAWSIIRSATTGKMALEPCLGPGSEVTYYRNCYSKRALQLRQSPSADSEVVHTLPLGTCFRSNCRVVSNQQLWISCVLPDKDEAWVTEVNEEDGKIMIQQIEPPGTTNTVYRNTHSGTVAVMSGLGYGQNSKKLGHLTQDSAFLGVERRLDERFEMWVKVYKSSKNTVEGWVPESVSGIVNSLEKVDAVDPSFDWALTIENWMRFTSKEETGLCMSNDNDNHPTLLQDLMSDVPAQQKESSYPTSNLLSAISASLQEDDPLILDEQEVFAPPAVPALAPQRQSRTRSHSKHSEETYLIDSRQKNEKARTKTGHKMQKDDLDLLAQINDFADKEKTRNKAVPERGSRGVDPPHLNPPSGKYENPLFVEMTCKPASGRILYCFDEKYPRWKEYVHDAPLCLKQIGKIKLKAKVVLPWGQESLTKTVEYHVQGKKERSESKCMCLSQLFCPQLLPSFAWTADTTFGFAKKSICNCRLFRRSPKRQSYQTVALQESDL